MRENRMAATAREGVPPRYRHPSATTAVGTHNNAPAASDATASQLLARASSSIATASRAAAQASPIPAKPDRRLTPPRSDKSSLTGRPSEIEVRSEEHTSELQSLRHLVCRLLLEKKN